jgi:hypothetical protein
MLPPWTSPSRSWMCQVEGSQAGRLLMEKCNIENHTSGDGQSILFGVISIWLVYYIVSLWAQGYLYVNLV